MKKTTIILAVSLGVTVVGSFFSPLVFGKQQEATQTTTFNILGANDTIPLNHPIESLVIESPQMAYFHSEDSNGFYITIRESPSATHPCIVVDKAWKGNMEFVNADPKIRLIYPMEALKKQKDVEAFVEFNKDSSFLGTLILPQGQLHQIESPVVAVELKSFNNADLTLTNTPRFTCTDCSFRSLTDK